MGAIPNGRPNRKKTYIIAVVLVVISLVVLSAFFYLLVGISPKNPHRPCVIAPIGLNLDRTTESSVNLVIVSAPEAATTDGAIISYTHNGTPVDVKATLYNATGTVVANYTNSAFDNIVPLTRGMTLVITPASGSVSTGDVITITSSQDTFSTSEVTVK